MAHRIADRHVKRLIKRKVESGELSPQEAEACHEIMAAKNAKQFKQLLRQTRGLADFKGMTEKGDHPILEWLAAHWQEILQVILSLIVKAEPAPAAEETPDDSGNPEGAPQG